MSSESLSFLQSDAVDNVPGPSTLNTGFRKDGTASKMRSHKGNVPILPKSKLCPHCTASFTRTTHLNRHLRTRKLFVSHFGLSTSPFKYVHQTRTKGSIDVR